jgi:hypothetical protein
MVLKPLVVGDVVELTSPNQTIMATVSIASPNGESIAVEFEGLFRLSNGAYVGHALPLLWVDGRQWVDIIGDTVVTLTRAMRH